MPHSKALPPAALTLLVALAALTGPSVTRARAEEVPPLVKLAAAAMLDLRTFVTGIVNGSTPPTFKPSVEQELARSLWPRWRQLDPAQRDPVGDDVVYGLKRLKLRWEQLSPEQRQAGIPRLSRALREASALRGPGGLPVSIEGSLLLVRELKSVVEGAPAGAPVAERPSVPTPEPRDDDEPAPRRTGRALAGALDGLYAGARAVPRFPGTGVTIIPDVFVFSPDGRFYNGFPRTDAAGRLDIEAAIREMPARSGSYRVEGSRIFCRFNDGRNNEWEYALVDIDGTRVFRKQGMNFFPRPPATGLRLEGRYRLSDARSWSTRSHVTGATQSMQVFAERDLTFDRSGRFTTSRFAGMSSRDSNRNDETTGRATGHAGTAEESGTYRIKGYTIELRFDDGRVVRESFVLPDDSLKMLTINGHPYFRL